MATPSGEPNLYELTGEGGTEITYSAGDTTGQPQLTYRVRMTETRTFTGNDIHSQDSELGKLISVTLERTSLVDAIRTVTLVLVLPELGNIQLGEEVPFQTTGTVITRTTGPDTIAGRPTYDLLMLQGVARFVES